MISAYWWDKVRSIFLCSRRHRLLTVEKMMVMLPALTNGERHFGTRVVRGG
jgi:hypothetical protein